MGDTEESRRKAVQRVGMGWWKEQLKHGISAGLLGLLTTTTAPAVERR